MKLTRRDMPLLLWCAVWASAVIATAWIFRGSHTMSYVEGAVDVVGFFGFAIFRARRNCLPDE